MLQLVFLFSTLCYINMTAICGQLYLNQEWIEKLTASCFISTSSYLELSFHLHIPYNSNAAKRELLSSFALPLTYVTCSIILSIHFAFWSEITQRPELHKGCCRAWLSHGLYQPRVDHSTSIQNVFSFNKTPAFMPIIHICIHITSNELLLPL